jgi:hypothetical protein
MSELHRLFDLPHGTKFRYQARNRLLVCANHVFVFLDHGDSGLVADYIPAMVAIKELEKVPFDRHRQGCYAAADSREEFEQLMVEVVDDAKRIEDLEDALSALLETIPDYKGDDRKIAVNRANELLRMK